MGRTGAYLVTMLAGALPALAIFGCLHFQKKRRLAAGTSGSALRSTAEALFWMFCGGMAAVTLTPRWVVWSVVDVLHGYGWNRAGYPFFERGTVNLIPFQTFALDGHSLYILAGNVVMFLPFGFFPGLLRSRCSWRWALAEGVCITLGIECWQLLIGRAFDVDDLLLNTLGVLCGYGLARLLGRLAPGFVQRFHPQSDLHEK